MVRLRSPRTESGSSAKRSPVHHAASFSPIPASSRSRSSRAACEQRKPIQKVPNGHDCSVLFLVRVHVNGPSIFDHDQRGHAAPELAATVTMSAEEFAHAILPAH